SALAGTSGTPGRPLRGRPDRAHAHAGDDAGRRAPGADTGHRDERGARRARPALHPVPGRRGARPPGGMTANERERIELLAVELATLAGAQIVAAMSRSLTVRYKGPQGLFRDPVSEVDRGVEVLIRARLAAEYPTHDILGEEILDRPGNDHNVVWAI